MAPTITDQLLQQLQHISPYLEQLRPYLIRPQVLNPLSAIGALTVLYIVNSIWSSLWVFLRPSSLPRSLHPTGQRYLTYALVTGSTDGIGRAVAVELSQRGFSLVLHGRNPAKLNALADEIHNAHRHLGAPRPELMIAQADRCSDLDFTALARPLQRRRLTVLVNNVGAQGHLSHDPFRRLDQFTADDITRLLDLNATFMTQLTRELLPLMLKASDPKVPATAWDDPVPCERTAPAGTAPRAQILNASSAAALGTPYVIPYAGTKAYVETFGAALRNEFRAERIPTRRIEVLGLRIGNVVTNTNQGDVRLFMPDAATYAKAILDRVGCGRAIVVPYFWHWAQVAFFTQIFGNAFFEWAMVINMRWAVEARDKFKAQKKA